MKVKTSLRRPHLDPAKMRAVAFQEHGKVQKLKYTYVQKPKPSPRDVIVKVRACALNHLDIWTLNGMPGVKIPLPHTLGCDISGEVVEKGSKVSGIALNRPVIVAPGIRCGKCSFCKDGWDSLCPDYKIVGLQVNGGYAEYVKVPAENVIPIGGKWNFEEWAAVPLVFLTAWHMLVTRANLKKGERVLIHAAGSGVGSAGIQIAKYLGAKIITTAGSDEKIRKAKSLGVEHAINYRKKDFAEEIKKITDGKGVDVVLEHIGPATFSKSLASLSKKGRLVTCGVTSGAMATFDLRHLFVRQLSISGSYMGSIQELKRIVHLIKHKRLRPVVDKVFPLREAAQALRRMQDRENFGKIILVP